MATEDRGGGAQADDLGQSGGDQREVLAQLLELLGVLAEQDEGVADGGDGGVHAGRENLVDDVAEGFMRDLAPFGGLEDGPADGAFGEVLALHFLVGPLEQLAGDREGRLGALVERAQQVERGLTPGQDLLPRVTLDTDEVEDHGDREGDGHIGHAVEGPALREPGDELLGGGVDAVLHGTQGAWREVVGEDGAQLAVLRRVGGQGRTREDLVHLRVEGDGLRGEGRGVAQRGADLLVAGDGVGVIGGQVDHGTEFAQLGEDGVVVDGEDLVREQVDVGGGDGSAGGGGGRGRHGGEPLVAG